MTNDEVNRWKLSAERIAELRGFIDQLLSTHNMYECIAIRDMLSEEITHEPFEQPVATPGATPTGEDSGTQTTESSRPRELLASERSSFDKTLARSPRRIIPARDADHCDYPDCEQHWTNVVAQARALLEPLAECDPAIRQWLKTPDLPKLQGASQSEPREQYVHVGNVFGKDAEGDVLVDWDSEEHAPEPGTILFVRLWTQAELDEADKYADERMAQLAETSQGASRDASSGDSILDHKVTVCSACLCAGCWQGSFYCEDYKSAQTVEKTVRELAQGNARESADFWFRDVNTGKVDEEKLARFHRSKRT